MFPKLILGGPIKQSTFFSHLCPDTFWPKQLSLTLYKQLTLYNSMEKQTHKLSCFPLDFPQSVWLSWAVSNPKLRFWVFGGKNSLSRMFEGYMRFFLCSVMGKSVMVNQAALNRSCVCNLRHCCNLFSPLRTSRHGHYTGPLFTLVVLTFFFRHFAYSSWKQV